MWIVCEWCKKDIVFEFYKEHKKEVHHIGVVEGHPKEMVQFYSEHTQKLLATQKQKVRKFLDHRCVEYAGGGVYLCKPLEGYNKTTYRLSKNEENEWQCTCQHNRMEKTMCAHIGALYEFFAMGQQYPVAVHG